MQDETLSYYDKNAGGLAARYESADVSLLQKLILREFSAGDTVLEIGSGSGRDAAFLLQHGLRVSGLDGSAQMIRRAETLHLNCRAAFAVTFFPTGFLSQIELLTECSPLRYSCILKCRRSG